MCSRSATSAFERSWDVARPDDLAVRGRQLVDSLQEHAPIVLPDTPFSQRDPAAAAARTQVVDIFLTGPLLSSFMSVIAQAIADRQSEIDASRPRSRR